MAINTDVQRRVVVVFLVCPSLICDATILIDWLIYWKVSYPVLMSILCPMMRVIWDQCRFVQLRTKKRVAISCFV